MMAETTQQGSQARPQPQRTHTLAKIYTGDQKQGQDPNVRRAERAESIRLYYSILEPTMKDSRTVFTHQITQFAHTNDILMKALNEVARIHPFISMVAFKAVVSLELSRRENNKKITLLHAKMQEMMGTLLELDQINHVNSADMDKMVALCTKLKADMEECGNACNSYQKLHGLSRLLRSNFWDTNLKHFIDVFETDKGEIRDVLIKHIAHGVNSISDKVSDIHEDVKSVKAFFETLRSPNEALVQMEVDSIKEKYGEENKLTHVYENLRKLLLKYEGKSTMVNDPETMEETETLSSIREELKADQVKLLMENRELFAKKLAMQTERIVTETQGAVTREGDRIINAFNNKKGPGDRIVDPVLHKIWKDMQFRGGVKARQLVLALREYYWEQLHPSVVDSESQVHNLIAPASPTCDRGRSISTPGISKSDEWALRYINIVRLQPLIEAFDDDASGFITVREVNQFTGMRPPNWNIPQWIAYWAAGFQISVISYCDRIKNLLARMQNIAESSLPANRVPISSYLASRSLSKLERLLAGISRGQSDMRWNDISSNLMNIVHSRDKYEEDKIEEKLKGYGWYIDEPSIVALLTGPGRIEMYLFTILYILVQRHCAIVELGQRATLTLRALKEAEESIQSVCQAVQDRLDGLKAIFRQQNFNVEEELRRFCFGMFSYFEESDQNFAATRSDYNAAGVNTNVTSAREPAIATEGLETQETILHESANFQLNTEGYERGALRVQDLRCDDLRGMWYGTDEHTSGYSTFGITALTIHEMTSDGLLKGSGLRPSGTFRIEGRYAAHDGKLVFTYLKSFDGATNPYWYFGTLTSDETEGDYIQGFWGKSKPKGDHEIYWFSQNSSWAIDSFKLHRKPIEFFTLRPDQRDLTTAGNRIKALWEYALTAARHRVQPTRFTSWKLIQKRRTQKNRYVNVYIKRCKHAKLTYCERSELVDLERTLSPADILFYRSLAISSSRKLAIFPYYCDNCCSDLERTRYMCLACTKPEKLLSLETVDFCGECVFKTFSIKIGSTASSHSPDHNILQSRTELYPRKCVSAVAKLDTAKVALKSSTHMEYTCSLCKSYICAPVWICVTCEDLTCVCVECNAKEQSHTSWAFSPEANVTAQNTHNWSHPLVLCHPESTTSCRTDVPEQAQIEAYQVAPLEKRMAQMEQYINGMVEQMGGLQQLLTQVLDKIPNVSA